jgi:quercetin dioxygenase-like cupin family protein
MKDIAIDAKVPCLDGLVPGRIVVSRLGSSAMNIQHWDERRDGPLSEKSLRLKLEARGYDVTRYTYPAGTLFETHTHAVDKIDAVLAGRFRITMDDGSVILGPGDSIEVPRGVRHAAEVVGEESVISLDAVKR